jgi:hypothetical protein
MPATVTEPVAEPEALDRGPESPEADPGDPTLALEVGRVKDDGADWLIPVRIPEALDRNRTGVKRARSRLQGVLSARSAAARRSVAEARDRFFTEHEAGKALVAAEARLKEEETALTAVRGDLERLKREWSAAVEAGTPTEDLDARQPELARREAYHAARVGVLKAAAGRAKEAARPALHGYLESVRAAGQAEAEAHQEAAFTLLSGVLMPHFIAYLEARSEANGYKAAAGEIARLARID